MNLQFGLGSWVMLGTLLLAPILGGLLTGIDRKITARLQHRYGPPILQPFYDFIKLWGKEQIAVNRAQLLWVYVYLFLVATSLVMLVSGQDLLMITFVLAFAAGSLVLGGLSVPSPYSRIGAHRELFQMLAYEPVLVLITLGAYMVGKQENVVHPFLVSSILSSDKPLMWYLPLMFLALLLILTIKLRKSPFDFSTSHHGHQELVKGVLTEYSGPYLALIELAHWYELIFMLGFVAMFWATNLWIALALAVGAYLLEIVIDNIYARMTWGWMLKIAWTVGIALCIVNLVLVWYKVFPW